jgi:hypothetical protein
MAEHQETVPVDVYPEEESHYLTVGNHLKQLSGVVDKNGTLARLLACLLALFLALFIYFLFLSFF